MLLCLEKAINHLSEVRGIPLVKPKQPSIASGLSINDVVSKPATYLVISILSKEVEARRVKKGVSDRHS